MNVLLLLEAGIRGVAIGIRAAGSGASSRDILWQGQVTSIANSAASLPSLVDAGLRSVGCNITDVCGAVVSTGPGSFTGIRVGIAYAFGLSIGFEAQSGEKFRWLGASTLQLLAQHYFLTTDQKSLLILPSTKTSAFAVDFDGQNVGIAKVFNLEDQKTAIYAGYNLVSIGHWESLSSAVGNKVTVLAVEDVMVQSIQCMSDYAGDQWPQSFKFEVPNANYLKKSSVEENAENKTTH